jgi:hypothetical protein
MALCNVPLDFDDSVNFDFNDLPERCSSASISGCSSASSSFGPHTPTSDRSTPFLSASLDFGSSFASSVDTVPFDLTPPSSAASNCFPMTPRGGNVTDFGYSGFPATPSRQVSFSGHPFSSCGTQLAHQQAMDSGFYPNHLGASPFMSTPSSVTQFDQSSDLAWMHTDSPISFEDHSSSSPSRLVDPFRSAKSEAEAGMMSPSMRSSAARKRAAIGEARHKTTALHQAQQRSQPNVRRQIKKERRLRSLETGGGSMAMGSVEPPNRHYCPEEGCNKGPYQRKEHLKRHIDS